jgi:hypothetical protein
MIVRGKCQKCGTDLQGDSVLCVLCFAKLHRPCPRCMKRTPGGNYKPILDRKSKKPIGCSYCNNERWIVTF